MWDIINSHIRRDKENPAKFRCAWQKVNKRLGNAILMTHHNIALHHQSELANMDALINDVFTP